MDGVEKAPVGGVVGAAPRAVRFEHRVQRIDPEEGGAATAGPFAGDAQGREIADPLIAARRGAGRRAGRQGRSVGAARPLAP